MKVFADSAAAALAMNGCVGSGVGEKALVTGSVCEAASTDAVYLSVAACASVPAAVNCRVGTNLPLAVSVAVRHARLNEAGGSWEGRYLGERSAWAKWP
jgi:hypothetical protein